MVPGQVDIEAVLAQLPDDLRTALLPLALEDTWHPVRSLALAPDLPDTWWSQVLEHLPVLPREDGTVQVPPELQATLTRHLATSRPRLYRDLALQHSDRAVQAGDIQQALALLHDVGEADRAHTQLEFWMSERLRAGQHALLQSTFESLPGTWINPRTQAVYWGSCLSHEDRERVVSARQAAHLAYDAGERNPRLLYMLGHALQLDGQYHPALRMVDEGLAAGTVGRDTLILLQLQSVLLGYLQRTAEHLEAALALLAEAERQGDLYFTAMAHTTIGYAREDMGDFPAAEDHYHRATVLMTRLSQWPQLATLLNNYAQSLAGAGRPAEALQRLEEARALPGLAPRHHAWLTFSAAIVHHRYGMHAEALTSSRRAAELLHAAHLPGDGFVALLLEAERLALDGQLAAAEQRRQEARSLAADRPSDQAQLHFTSGVLAFVREDWQGAEQSLQHAFGGELTAWDQVRGQLYLIALARQRGEQPESAALVESLDSLETDAPLLTDALLLRDALVWLGCQPGWEVRLARVFGGPSLAGRTPLRLELFGPLEVYTQTGLLRFPLRRSAELLTYLALHGPVSRVQIIASLWEGQPDARTVDLFKKTLRSLRDALRSLLPFGADPVVVEQGRYVLHPLLDLSTAWLPEGLFPAPALRWSGPLEVRGPFLGDGQGPWADDARTEVHERLLTHLLKREEEGDPTVQQALRVARGLT